MLDNASLIANIGIGAADNGPSNVCFTNPRLLPLPTYLLLLFLTTLDTSNSGSNNN